MAESYPRLTTFSLDGNDSLPSIPGGDNPSLAGFHDVVREVSELKRKVMGDIVVYGSGRLAHTLIEQDPVDELRLMICPFALGDGERLFDRISDQKSVCLVDTRAVGDGLVRLTYQRVRDA
ncbi:MAG: dihydrofolate reductase family protein [Mycobacteriales bacterium]